MVLDFVYTAPACGEVDTRPFVVYAVHYSYFGTILFCLTLGVGAIGSLVTQPQEETTVSIVFYFTSTVNAESGIEPGSSFNIVHLGPDYIVFFDSACWCHVVD